MSDDLKLVVSWMRAASERTATPQAAAVLARHAAIVDAASAEVAALRAERDALRVALTQIALQETTDEMDEDQLHDADIEGAFDAVVGIARAALEPRP